MKLNKHKLKVILAERGLNLTKLSTLINVNRCTLSRWINLTSDIMPLGKVCRIATILALTDEEIIQVFFQKNGQDR